MRRPTTTVARVGTADRLGPNYGRSGEMAQAEKTTNLTAAVAAGRDATWRVHP